MRVIWTERALSDIDDILDYFEDVSPRAGVDLGRGLILAAQDLETFPYMGPRLPAEVGPPKYRALVHMDVRIIYRFDERAERVYILRVWDGRRNPDRLEIIDHDLESVDSSDG